MNQKTGKYEIALPAEFLKIFKHSDVSTWNISEEIQTSKLVQKIKGEFANTFFSASK